MIHPNVSSGLIDSPGDKTRMLSLTRDVCGSVECSHHWAVDWTSIRDVCGMLSLGCGLDIDAG
eukprot:7084009-Pyramimonas_sp.AAC.1